MQEKYFHTANAVDTLPLKLMNFSEMADGKNQVSENGLFAN